VPGPHRWRTELPPRPALRERALARQARPSESAQHRAEDPVVKRVKEVPVQEPYVPRGIEHRRLANLAAAVVSRVRTPPPRASARGPRGSSPCGGGKGSRPSVNPGGSRRMVGKSTTTAIRRSSAGHTTTRHSMIRRSRCLAPRKHPTWTSGFAGWKRRRADGRAAATSPDALDEHRGPQPPRRLRSFSTRRGFRRPRRPPARSHSSGPSSSGRPRSNGEACACNPGPHGPWSRADKTQVGAADHPVRSRPDDVRLRTRARRAGTRTCTTCTGSGGSERVERSAAAINGTPVISPSRCSSSWRPRRANARRPARQTRPPACGR
jgi:hypothetical protein